MPQATIALVEDEPILREELSFQLGHFGFHVETFANAGELYRRMAVHRFAAIVLDIGLTGEEDGLSVCRYLRAHDKQIGIIFVSARALRDDRLQGLHAGADAYLTKPVDIDELYLLLRRLLARDESAQDPTGTDSHAGGWQLTQSGDFLQLPGGQRIRLTINETRILKVLLDKPGRVAVTPELATALGLLPEEYDKHRIEVIISRLRDKVLRESGHPLPVLTKRGIGYLFETA